MERVDLVLGDFLRPDIPSPSLLWRVVIAQAAASAVALLAASSRSWSMRSWAVRALTPGTLVRRRGCCCCLSPSSHAFRPCESLLMRTTRMSPDSSATLRSPVAASPPGPASTLMLSLLLCLLFSVRGEPTREPPPREYGGMGGRPQTLANTLLCPESAGVIGNGAMVFNGVAGGAPSSSAAAGPWTEAGRSPTSTRYSSLCRRRGGGVSGLRRHSSWYVSLASREAIVS